MNRDELPNKLRKIKSKTTLLSANDIGELFLLALKKRNPKIQKAAVKLLGLLR